MTFRQKLIELRQDAGMTQDQLSGVSGIPLPTLRKLEQGQRTRVSLAVASRLAKCFGKTCEVFAGCSDIDDDPPPAPKKPRKK